MDVIRSVVFFVYQRTTFVDALRSAARLKETGLAEPTFLVAAGTAALLKDEIDTCRRRGIACVTEEELRKPAPAAAHSNAADEPIWLTFLYRAFKSIKRRTLWGLFTILFLMRDGLLWILDGLLRVLPNQVTIFLSDRIVSELQTLAAKHDGHLPRRIEAGLGITAATDTIRAFEARYHTALRALKPDFLCLSEDIPGPTTAPLIKAARQLDIPSVIVPFTIPNPREAIEDCFAHISKKGRPRILTHIANQLVLRMHPGWVVTHKNRALLRVSAGLIFACERLGIAPPNPWIVNSGYADRIAVESERMLRIYRAAGFPDAQLALTGSSADDLLYTALSNKIERRDALYREFKLSSDRGLLLSSLIPDQVTAGAAPNCEFSRYDDLINFWVRTLVACSGTMNVVIKINPRYRREEFLHLERFGVVIAPHDTIELVPLADIYVTSVSSTLRWAIACGVPSVNYDVYRFRYGDYLDAPGVLHAESKEEFAGAVAALAGDEKYRDEVRRRQLPTAQSWGCLDGKSTERLAELFDELRQKSNHRSATDGLANSNHEAA